MILLEYIRAGYLSRSFRAAFSSRVSSNAKIGKKCSVIGSTILGEVVLHEGVQVFKASLSGPIAVGRYTYLSGPRIDIVGQINRITIGNFCSIARGVQIQEYNHSTGGLSTAFLSRRFDEKRGISNSEIESKGPITIESDVWIGANCIVVSGVTIGVGAVVAAGSVVTKDVPPYSIVGGNPAKVLRYRFDNPRVVQSLVNSEWWKLPLEEIEELNKVFEGGKYVD